MRGLAEVGANGIHRRLNVRGSISFDTDDLSFFSESVLFSLQTRSQQWRCVERVTKMIELQLLHAEGTELMCSDAA